MINQMIMKTLCTLVLCFLLTSSIKGQCEFELKEIDDFTNEKHVVSEKSKFSLKTRYYGSLQFSRKGENVWLIVDVNDGEIECYDLETKMYFKFENGEVLLTQNEANRIRQSIQTITLDNGERLDISGTRNENCRGRKVFKSKLSDADFKIFQKHALEKVRVESADEYFDYDIPSKFRTKISQNAACVDLGIQLLDSNR